MARPAPVRTILARVLGAGLAVSGSGLGLGCSGAHEPTQHEAPVRLAFKPTTNVPALLGESIEVLRRRLGSGTTLPAIYKDLKAYAHLDPRATDSVQTFRTGGLLLVASYDVHSRRVHDLLLLGRHEDSLMQRAALHPNASDYLVLPVFLNNKPGVLLGLRVVETSLDQPKGAPPATGQLMRPGGKGNL